VSHDTWFLLGLFSGTAVCAAVLIVSARYGIAALICAPRRRAARQSLAVRSQTLAVINRRREAAYARLFGLLKAGGNDQRYLDELTVARDTCLALDAEVAWHASEALAFAAGKDAADRAQRNMERHWRP
jgi:hypothetical protein